MCRQTTLRRSLFELRNEICPIRVIYELSWAHCSPKRSGHSCTTGQCAQLSHIARLTLKGQRLASIARNYVKMQMPYRLPGSLSVVLQNIESLAGERGLEIKDEEQIREYLNSKAGEKNRHRPRKRPRIR